MRSGPLWAHRLLSLTCAVMLFGCYGSMPVDPVVNVDETFNEYEREEIAKALREWAPTFRFKPVVYRSHAWILEYAAKMDRTYEIALTHGSWEECQNLLGRPEAHPLLGIGLNVHRVGIACIDTEAIAKGDFYLYPIIAHEIGHTMRLPHTDNRKNAFYRPGEAAIMTSQVSSLLPTCVDWDLVATMYPVVTPDYRLPKVNMPGLQPEQRREEPAEEHDLSNPNDLRLLGREIDHEPDDADEE